MAAVADVGSIFSFKPRTIIITREIDEVVEPLKSAIKSAVQAVADLYADGDTGRVELSVTQGESRAYVDGKLVDMGRD